MTARTAQLDHELIAALRDAVPVPLVLHGSSGVADDELGRAVAHGIVKINVGTILNVAFTRAVRSPAWRPTRRLVDPRNYLSPARAEIAAVVTRLVAALRREARCNRQPLDGLAIDLSQRGSRPNRAAAFVCRSGAVVAQPPCKR